MKIVDISVKRPVTTAMITLAVIVFGLISLDKLPINLMPDISYPTITVKTDWEGVAPEEIEEQLTKPIEENVAIMNGLQNMVSYSKPGMSIITLEFNWDTDIDNSVLNLREILSRIDFPDDAENPQILRYNPNLEPIMQIAFSSEKDTLTDIRMLLKDNLKDNLLTLNGVASLNVKGGSDRNLFIELDTLKLSALNLSVSDIYQQLNQENESFSAGQIEQEEGEYLIRLLNKFENLDDVKNLIITTKDNKKILLKSIADIYVEKEKEQSITKLNGQRAVFTEVYKTSGANTVTVAGEIKRELANFKNNFDLDYSIVKDKSVFISSSIKSVFSSAIYGGILAIIILYLFLRDKKPTMIIAGAIPISIIAVFLGMYLKGISLNIMSIGGLALGVGMLVDSSIVVLESIDRVKKEKYDNLKKSSIYGTKLVGTAILASTLTTISVFLPIVFVEGIAGKLFADQAFTVAFALIASLIVSISVIPMVSALSFKRKRLVGDEMTEVDRKEEGTIYLPEKILKRILSFLKKIYVIILVFILRLIKKVTSFKGKKGVLESVLNGFEEGFNRLQKYYNNILEKALHNRKKVLIYAGILFVVSFILFQFLDVEMMPKVNRDEFTIYVSTEKNMDKNLIESMVDDFVVQMKKSEMADIVYSRIGEEEEETVEVQNEETIQLYVRLNEGINPNKGIEYARNLLENMPGIEYKLEFPKVFETQMNPIQVEIYGDDLDSLKNITEKIKNKISQNKKLEDIRVTLRDGKPEVAIKFNRDKLAKYNLDVRTISRMLELEIKGDTTNKYDYRGEELDIKVIGRGRTLQTYRRLKDFSMNTSSGKVLLDNVADIKLITGPSSITRKGQERVSLITANYTRGSLNTIISDIKKVVNNQDIPSNFRIEFGGQSEEMKKSGSSLTFAIFLAIFLVYIVMASQFESLVHPFIIIFSIPFSLIGVIIALFITGNSINIISLIGLVMLAGIVVNNGIVLVDYINHLIRNENMEVIPAIIKGGNVRLRPIMMTTLTTVLGLVPMAILGGNGSELRSPLAWTVIGGLLSSTALTLVFIPVVYSFLEKGNK
ncbi:MAG: efflux RND transporter permease subunit [Candidatus Mcinerneyibacterium aminivorans]|uniref:Efflux RND transporter permease subunit n=1 Tax=Candidatus Mcinerneyibacterium aminivorans TaxID=2703815 RepID=A0A5D0MKK0_9BACT|nr:MAG: efflux RND transporter permease subunit [Candidatus Mcinerneyibacterium aminivorans]